MDRLAARPFSADDFRIRAMRLTEPHDGGSDYGDHRLNPDLRELIVHDHLRDAAVLIPVVDRGEEATMLLTKRTETLRSHSGQVAFPGGRIDPGDATAEDAALREAFEEVGLPSRAVEVIGRLPDYVTGSGYRIVPVVGIVTPPFEFVINEQEVDAVFEVPLGFLMDAANHRRESRLWKDRERFYYTMPYGERFIWGVTAGIIRTLYERLYA
jgi:8-oxo-dGTP pyrophosphatase MutT (NUDIX family)